LLSGSGEASGDREPLDDSIARAAFRGATNTNTPTRRVAADVVSKLEKLRAERLSRLLLRELHEPAERVR
jgi:hypothetical protein